ncbi:MAG: penicillin-binding protein 2 [candidate division WOR-3 bacterium]
MKACRVLHSLLFIISLIFFSYLFYIQCLKSTYYRRISEKWHQKMEILCGTRGNIYDRNGVALATSEPCFSVFCTPRYTRDKNTLAEKLAMLSQRPLSELKQLINEKNFFWVETKINTEKKDRYLELKDPSIGVVNDLKRIYTMPDAFGSIIGRCSKDNRGLEGIELYFDEILRGKSGFVVYQREATGDVFPYYSYPEKNPEPGSDLYLTMDLQIQTILFTHLKECLKEKVADVASGLVLNPQTGEILAMANISKSGNFRNSAICDEFEPGSTFKIVALAFSLINGISEKEIFDTEGGKIKINGHTIHDFKDYGAITLERAIVHSSNVVMAKLSRRFNERDFMIMVKDFGFTQLSGIEFPGEITGRLLKRGKLNEIEFATLMFGQGITCNLLQLAFAYQAIANRGVLNKPLIVAQIKKRTKLLYQAEPLKIRRVLDEDIAKRITNILCQVVEAGTGVEAKIEGMRIAGKTGTAQKVVDGKYSENEIVATFVGYFPADNPEYLIAIMIDNPQKGQWASTITAPVFKQIAHRICQIRNFEYAYK